LVLAWLVRELLDHGADEQELRTSVDPGDVERLRRALAPFRRDVVAESCDIAPDDLDDLLAAVRRAGRLACTTGTGVTFGRQPVVTEWLRWALLIVTGSIDRPGGMRCRTGFFDPPERRAEWDAAPPEGRRDAGPPSRPELSRWMGEYPAAAMVSEIEAGSLRGLVVHGGNPLAAFPDTVRTKAALESLDVLAVADVSANALTQIATHVLPTASMLERADMAGRERGCYTPALFPVGADRRPAWWVYAQLARRMGHDVLDERDPDACTDDAVLELSVARAPDRYRSAVAAGPRGAAEAVPMGWVRARALPGGRWRLAPELLLERLPDLLKTRRSGTFVAVSRRQVRSVNSVRYRRSQDAGLEQPDVLLHPDDAATVGVSDHQRVRVHNGTGELVGIAHVDPRVRRGVVSIPGGWSDVNPNHLVSRTEDVDDLTGQPRISCVDVEVEPILEAIVAGAG
jgi:anaerobic selenocysteine-containing dehydrogenase